MPEIAKTVGWWVYFVAGCVIYGSAAYILAQAAARSVRGWLEKRRRVDPSIAAAHRRGRA